MNVLKKWGRWKKKGTTNSKGSKKLRFILIKDDLRSAKRPPDWLMELQEQIPPETEAEQLNPKTA